MTWLLGCAMALRILHLPIDMRSAREVIGIYKSMGAGASLELPAQVDKKTAQQYAGDRFDATSFDEKASKNGLVPREEILRAGMHRAINGGRKTAKKSREAIGANAPGALCSKSALCFFEPPRGSAAKSKAQTFDAWVREPHPSPFQNLGTKAKPIVRPVIYLLPMGSFDNAPKPALLLEWCRAYFHGLRVELLPDMPSDPAECKTKQHGVLSARKINELLSRKLPADGFCVLGLTMASLVSEEGGSELLGLAKLNQRVGIFSLNWGKFFGEAGSEEAEGDALNAPTGAALDAGRLLRRSLIVMTHELTHMFGVRHCAFFHCRMMDAYKMDDVLDDTDVLPADVCPVELRKLQHAITAAKGTAAKGAANVDAGTWVLDRYRALLAACRSLQAALGAEASAVLAADAVWFDMRVAELGGALALRGGADAANGQECGECEEADAPAEEAPAAEMPAADEADAAKGGEAAAPSALSTPPAMREQASWCHSDEEERTCGEPSPPSSTRTLRVATLNVLFLRHPTDVAEAVRSHLPLDVLALQEVREREDLEVFAAALGMRVAVVLEACEHVCLSNALLVRADEPEELACASMTLDHRLENRAAVAIELPRANARFICTHLDHRAEEARCAQYQQLEAKMVDSAAALFLLGDFNALRRADYDESAWAALVSSREEAGILDSVSTLTDEIQQKLVDCWYAADKRSGSVTTSIHSCRIDYVWASSAALQMWAIRECAHVWLVAREDREEAVKATTKEGDLLTDHALVVCSLERKA